MDGSLHTKILNLQGQTVQAQEVALEAGDVVIRLVNSGANFLVGSIRSQLPKKHFIIDRKHTKKYVRNS